MPDPSILLVCQFGLPVRGLSPYGDALFEALNGQPDVDVRPSDYRAPYPGFLHPAAGALTGDRGDLHWANPLSWRRLASADADIIHLQHWSPPMAGYLAPLASMVRRAGKRLVVTVHNPTAHESLRPLEPFERGLFKRADALVVHDARGAMALSRRFGIETERIHIIAHGVRTASAPPCATAQDHESLGLDPSRRYICVFGNLRGYKGIDRLLNACRQVLPALPGLDLVIAGRLWSGQSGLTAGLVAKALKTHRDSEVLRAALAHPELRNRVHLREGFQPDQLIDSLLRVSELAVFPYVRFDSQSGAACRAAGMGCPLLVSDIGGLPDLAIDSQWLVEPGDSDALATALLAKLSDPDALIRGRVAQLARVDAYAWPRIAEQHATLYRSLPGARGRSKKH